MKHGLASIGRSAFMLLLVLSGLAESVQAAPVDDLPSDSRVLWRDAEHGGFNALYFLMKMYGKPRSYEECIECLQSLPRSASEIADAAETLGVQLTSRTMSPEELRQIRLPVIVHLFGDSTDTGYFFVLLQIQPHRIVFLDGPSAAVSTMDPESFHRRWSGLVVYPSVHGRWSDLFCVIAGGTCGFAGVFLAGYWRRRKCSS